MDIIVPIISLLMLGTNIPMAIALYCGVETKTDSKCEEKIRSVRLQANVLKGIATFDVIAAIVLLIGISL